MEKARWYYDLISPFAYLHFHSLAPLRERLQIEPVPVLFAGMLKHWGTKGPAETAPKRLHTYQYCVWQAGVQGLPFRMPPRHPFNPLAAQRLMVALEAGDDVVGNAFGFIFGEGRDPEVEFDALAERLSVGEPGALIGRPEVKQQLIANTQEAIDAGVFGVPSLVLRGQVFWGNDTVAWATRFLDEPGLFERPEYTVARATGVVVVRS
ncbi:MAG TPA: disulfide bond formation protein DsbA [Massilia sp.]|nr:disulfide bond formation protein DsbA [Massilia sp.]